MLPDDWPRGAAVLLWLAVLSGFDLKNRAIPHAAWVALPGLLAGIYRGMLGGWPLPLLAAGAVLLSERRRLAQRGMGIVLCSVFLALPALIVAGGAALLPGALAILGFWLAWEARAWGGADALAAITLALIWPDAGLVAAVLVAHLAAAGALWGFELYTKRRFRPALHRIPGMPVLALAALARVLLFGS